MNTKKYWMTLGTAIATSKLAKAISSVDADDIIGLAGLTRRKSHIWESVAFFGLGALAGAGAALLLAPASGRETREKIGGEVDRLAGMANEKIQQMKEQAPSLLSRHAETDNKYS